MPASNQQLFAQAFANLNRGALRFQENGTIAILGADAVVWAINQLDVEETQSDSIRIINPAVLEEKLGKANFNLLKNYAIQNAQKSPDLN